METAEYCAQHTAKVKIMSKVMWKFSSGIILYPIHRIDIVVFALHCDQHYHI